MKYLAINFTTLNQKKNKNVHQNVQHAHIEPGLVCGNDSVWLCFEFTNNRHQQAQDNYLSNH